MSQIIRLIRQLSPAQASMLLVGLMTVLHIFVAMSVGLGVDEAHYALYGKFLDWSYFDHPPMVGWLQAIAERFSDTNLALRTIPILLSMGSAYVLYRLTGELFPEAGPWTPFIAVLLLESALMVHLIGLSMLPEAPLLLTSLCSVWALYRVAQSNRLVEWLVLGLCLGLAGLSKYTAVTLVVTVVVYLLATRHWQYFLRYPLWLAAGIAFICILPVLYWNMTHDWISFDYQLHHGFKHHSWSILRFTRAQLAQFATYAPLVYGFGIAAMVSGIKEWRSHDGVKLCLLFSIPILLLFGWGAGFETSLPHWTAVAWVGLIPLTARWLTGHWDNVRVRWLAWISGAFAIVVLVIVHVIALYPAFPFPKGEHPLRDLLGWKQAAHRAETLREQMATTPGPKPVLMVDNWSLASRLAWYARPQRVLVTDTRYDQFDIWFGELKKGDRGIMVIPSYFSQPSKSQLGLFEHCEKIDQMPVKLKDIVAFSYVFYSCVGYKD